VRNGSLDQMPGAIQFVRILKIRPAITHEKGRAMRMTLPEQQQ
jgi:hypothetical protein